MFLFQTSRVAIQNHCDVHMSLRGAYNKSEHTEERKHSRAQIHDF
jgi:hypothetical protein